MFAAILRQICANIHPNFKRETKKNTFFKFMDKILRKITSMGGREIKDMIRLCACVALPKMFVLDFEGREDRILCLCVTI